MDLSTFLKLLHNNLNPNQTIYKFVNTLFKSCISDLEENPIEDYLENTIYKIYYGYTKISKKKARIIRNNINLDRFYDYLSTFSNDKIDSIVEELANLNISISEDETYEDIGSLFLKTLTSIYSTKDLSTTNNLYMNNRDSNSSFINNVLTINNSEYKFSLYKNIPYSNNFSNHLIRIYSDKVQTKLFTLNDIIDLPKRFSTKFTYNYNCFNKANNYKQNLIRNFANGNSEFEKLEKSLYNFLLTIDLSNDCCEFDKYFHMIDKSLSWNDNKLKLFKINNFITNEIKIGILHILLNEGKITI